MSNSISVANYNHILSTQQQEVLQQRENALHLGSNQNRQSDTSVTSPKSPVAFVHISSPGTKSNHVTASPVKGNDVKRKDALPDNTCPKCKRTLHSRSALCEVGNHWVHYHCDRLT